MDFSNGKNRILVACNGLKAMSGERWAMSDERWTMNDDKDDGTNVQLNKLNPENVVPGK